MPATPAIRIGIGGWSYPPWRGTFYPAGLRQADELGFAGKHLTAIEINATFHRLQKPASFAAWARAVPDGFMFALKASRFAVTRPDLAAAEAPVERFLAQGIAELGDRLGPILWQLPHGKRFDERELAGFLALLPASLAGLPLRHALQPRHESFRDPLFAALMRKAGAATVYAQSAKYPPLAADTAGFAYVRLEDAREEEPAGFTAGELDAWAANLRAIAAGRTVRGPADAPESAEPTPAAKPPPRDVFAFVINGAKVRAPAAAQELIARLQP